MNIKYLIFAAILVIGNQLCFAQVENDSKELKPISFNPITTHSPRTPLYILKSGGETLEIDPDKDERLDLESLDSRYVKSIQVFKDADATVKYGDKGTHGVVVIYFKESYILSKAVVTKLKWGK